MHDHMRTARRDAFLLAACLVAVMAILAPAAAAFGRGAEVRMLVREGKPHEVAECMVQLRLTWGECEVGMFTGTYPAAWDSAPELVQVRDAVRRVRAAGGRWAFADSVRGRPWSVCAVLARRAPRCSTDVESAAALAFGDPARGKSTPGVLAVSPARRRVCTAAALATLRKRAAGGGGQALHAELAERARACGASPL
jgi:hypothetical protein